ncbi:MAG: helix-turn-helix transcriptional regulator [Lachnospiraceae bacterium]|nr:helix-turn-helix transcriptional regulator [Lachnospiraceae bacterium]
MGDNRLGAILKKMRKFKGFTQEYVASNLYISRQEYSHYETGRVMPSSEMCYKLANILSISPDQIIPLTVSEESRNVSTNKVAGDFDIDSLSELLQDKDLLERIQKLPQDEKILLFLYNSIPADDREEIIEILKIKYRKRKKMNEKP